MLWKVAFGALLVASGCGSLPSIDGTVVVPARIPVRAYPFIYVASSLSEPEESVARSLARRLGEAKKSTVEWISRDAVAERMRTAGFPDASTLLLIEIEVDRGFRPEFVTTPSGMCGPGSACVGGYGRRTVVSVPYLRARVTVTETDAVTGADGTVVHFEAQAEAEEALSLNALVASRVYERIAAMVDQEVTEVSVDLAEMPGVDASRAVDALGRGDVAAAARAFEDVAAAGATFEGRPAASRAAVLRNWAWCLALGQGDAPRPGEALDRAAALMARARVLDPDGAYDDESARLARVADAVRKTNAQRALAERNFARVR
ncbi:MAG: hypothetical protein KC417_06785 [Myxococcales bacterium]|nr:hypothetical protein [Myxococcales bacterium]